MKRTDYEFQTQTFRGYNIKSKPTDVSIGRNVNPLTKTSSINDVKVTTSDIPI